MSIGCTALADIGQHYKTKQCSKIIYDKAADFCDVYCHLVHCWHCWNTAEFLVLPILTSMLTSGILSCRHMRDGTPLMQRIYQYIVVSLCLLLLNNSAKCSLLCLVSLCCCEKAVPILICSHGIGKASREASRDAFLWSKNHIVAPWLWCRLYIVCLLFFTMWWQWLLW